MRIRMRALGVSAMLLLLQPAAAGADPIGHFAFDHTNIITPADPTTFLGVTFEGIEGREMFDRRVNDRVLYNAFVFDASFSDGQSLEILLNPEFGTEAAAQVVAETYGGQIGQLPRVLRALLREVVIHDGLGSAGGGLGGVLIHTDSAEATFAAGLWEETLVHEAGHSLNDSHVSTDGWVAAREADGGFISVYAQDFPGSEDVTETFLRWFAVRYRLDRIAPEEASFILSQVPNRLAYFDAQNFDVSTPVPVPEPGTMGLLLAGLIAASVRRRR